MDQKLEAQDMNKKENRKPFVSRLLLIMGVYMVLCPLIVLYLLFFSSLDFLMKIMLIALSAGILPVLALFNLVYGSGLLKK